MYKKTYFFGTAFFIISVILAAFFYKERIIFVDLSYHLFQICRTGTFVPQNLRFVSDATQLFPMAAVRLGLPLQQVILVYSTGFPILYLLFYLLIGFAFKSYKIAICFLLTSTLFVSHTYFWTQSELPQGLAVMMFAFGVFESRPVKKWKLTLRFAMLPLLLFTVSFAHPLLLFPFMFVIGFLYQETRDGQRRSELIGFAISYILFVVFKMCFFTVAYDNQAFGGIKNFVYQFPDYFSLYSHKRFFRNCTSIYSLIPVSLVIINVFYCRTRNWYKLGLFNTFFIAYYFLISVSFPGADTTAFYIENLYIPLGVFIAFPLVYDMLPLIKKPRLVLAATALPIVYMVVRVLIISNTYTDRLNYLDSIITQYQGRKVILDSRNLDMQLLQMTWGTSYECWILSTINHGKAASVLITDNPESRSGDVAYYQQFVAQWGAFSYNELPKNYFPFGDTISHYELISK